MTNKILRKVKDIAITMLETPVKAFEQPANDKHTTEFIEHPFFFSRFFVYPDDEGNLFHDILSSDDDMQDVLRRFKGFIEKTESIESIIMFMNKPYRLQFLKLIQNMMSPDEFSRLLAFVLTYSGSPNDDAITLSL